MSNELQEFIVGLRALADWIEASDPRLDIFIPSVGINIFSHSKEEFATKAKLFGASDKVSSGDFYMLRKNFGSHVKVDLNIRHATICERVLVETKVIPEHVIPATPEMLVPERIEEKYEWRCPESILHPEAEVAR